MDVCSINPVPHLEDDSCQEGTNGNGNGYTDWCSALVYGRIASDVCIDGKPENDICVSKSSTDGMNDVCPGGGKDVDDCNAVSDDYCLANLPESDTCSAYSPDECPGGGMNWDICLPVTYDKDECTSVELTDACYPNSPQYEEDECPTKTALSDKCRPFFGDTDECSVKFNDRCGIVFNDSCNPSTMDPDTPVE
jgi:hypothetical protein